MKRIIKHFQVAVIGCLFVCFGCSAAVANVPEKVLFVYGGWEGHEPVAYRDVLVPWLETQGFEVIVSDSLESYADEALMAEVDLVVQIWTMGIITQPQLDGLLTAIENGSGIAGWHGGLGDAFRNSPRYQYMIGGQWVDHPGNDGIPYRVNITNTEDAITRGLEDFDVVSEQYYMHVDPNNKVLATTTFNGSNDAWIKGAVMPVVWKRQYGKGRVFYTSLGHKPAIHEIPEVLSILQRGILWASRSKYDDTEDLVSPKYLK